MLSDGSRLWNALLFPQTTMVPWDEAVGTFLMGNAISPAQAALMLSYLDKAIAKQLGCPPVLEFKNFLASIRAAAGTCDGKVIVRLDNGCWTLRPKLEAPPQALSGEALCPLCQRPCRLPLLVACKTCFVIACEQCITDECKPEHGRVARDMTQRETHDQGGQAALFKVIFAYGEGSSLNVEEHPTLANVRRAHAISNYDWFFQDGLQRTDNYATGPNDTFYVVKCSRAIPDCPLEATSDAAAWNWAMTCTLPQLPQPAWSALTPDNEPASKRSKTQLDRSQEAPPTGPTLPWDVHPDQARVEFTASSLSGCRPDANEDGICGFVDIEGRFYPLPRPDARTTWPQWIGDKLPIEADRLWVTSNSTPLPMDYMLLPHTTYLLRLHFMLPGGTKAQGKGPAKHDALIKKLASHLVSKGVPEPDAKDRAGDVLQVIAKALKRAAEAR